MAAIGKTRVGMYHEQHHHGEGHGNVGYIKEGEIIDPLCKNQLPEPMCLARPGRREQKAQSHQPYQQQPSHLHDPDNVKQTVVILPGSNTIAPELSERSEAVSRMTKSTTHGSTYTCAFTGVQIRRMPASPCRSMLPGWVGAAGLPCGSFCQRLATRLHGGDLWPVQRCTGAKGSASRTRGRSGRPGAGETSAHRQRVRCNARASGVGAPAGCGRW